MEEPYNITLGLGIGGGGGDEFISNQGSNLERKPPVQFHILFPPCAKDEEEATRDAHEMSRFRIRTSDEKEDVTTDTTDTSNNNKGGHGPRKKLRLTTEQSIRLEESFGEHHTLNPTQKKELANQLNLQQRQVEVWFQNRRARTKLKQTEVDCEFLKKCCENLSDENRRLKKELQELRSLKPMESRFYTQLPRGTTLNMCPSCKRMTTPDHGKKSLGNFDAVVAKQNFYSRPVKDSSMAC